MKKPPLEVEVKFYLSDMNSYEQRLRSIGANLVRPRTHELNYRFDTPSMSLTREHRVLRLRQDTNAILTYKGPAQNSDSVSIRPEIEFEVSDLESAQALLEALGFCLSVQYEKWRTVYEMGGLEITLDEMPFGNFTEIEGGEPTDIQKIAAQLALNWTNRITCSYLMLFDRLKTKRKLEIKDLTFEELQLFSVSPEDMGVKAADIPLFM